MNKTTIEWTGLTANSLLVKFEDRQYRRRREVQSLISAKSTKEKLPLRFGCENFVVLIAQERSGFTRFVEFKIPRQTDIGETL
jgi:hypothetical protein